MLIILATISINAVFGENGLIAKSEQSKEFHEQEKAKENLNLLLGEYKVAKHKDGVTLIEFLQNKQAEGEIAIEEITDNEDGTISVVIDGYQAIIQEDTLDMIDIGKADKLLPRIMKIETSITKTSFTAKARVLRASKGIKYYYKLQSDSDDKYTEITNITEAKGAEVTGLVGGTTYDIKVVAENENGTVEDKTEVTITKVMVESIRLNSNAETINKGKTFTLIATINPGDATNKKVTWTSNNEEVAKVSESGVVTGIKEGTAKITAKSTDGSDKEAICTITVESVSVADIKGGEIFTSKETIKDEKGNKIVIPKGFKVAADSGSTVQDGIVIEDGTADKNQFVWIPVSNINHDGSNKIIKNDGSEVEITLGRYKFKTSTGTPIKVQYGSEYAATTADAVAAGNVSQYMVDYYYELTDSRISNNSAGKDGTNTTAKNLQAFIESVRDNHGYYLARYEASKSTIDATKPASKVADVWNNVTQPVAATAARKMYEGNTNIGVESDLCNSYGWDTAIVYIQVMGHSNYANANRDTTGNTSPLKTGQTGDEKCKIFDMAANYFEWTTEYMLNVSGGGSAYPCTTRGGNYLDSNRYTGRRLYSVATNSSESYGSFRMSLYL